VTPAGPAGPAVPDLPRACPPASPRRRVPVFVPPADLTLDEALDLAAVVLVLVGWCQGRAVDRRSGRMCAEAAVCYVLTGAPSAMPGIEHPYALLYARLVIALNAAVPGGHLNRWNDARGRTRDDVIRLFTQVAADKRRPVPATDLDDDDLHGAVA
jgi:hypothetical protein